MKFLSACQATFPSTVVGFSFSLVSFCCEAGFLPDRLWVMSPYSQAVELINILVVQFMTANFSSFVIMTLHN